MTGRYGNWIQTYTGRQFWPMDPRPDEVDIRDIAHALSMLCRFGGHSNRFYSVAEHCVLMARRFGTVENARWALLHDASEAYVVDVPRPIKHHPSMRNYRVIEDGVMFAILEHFHFGRENVLDVAPPAAVKEADARILITERDELMGVPPMPWESESLLPLPIEGGIRGWAPEIAEMYFLDTANQLGLI